MHPFIFFLMMASPSWMAVLADAMWARRTREYENKQEPDSKRFRSNAAELFLENTLSAERTISLIDDAAAGGCKNLEDLTSKPEKLNGKRDTNKHRNLTRKLLKGCLWPPLYYAKIPVFDIKTQSEANVWTAFLLPHEVLSTLVKYNALNTNFTMSEQCRSHLESMRQKFSQPEAFPIGVWLDGVPCNWDRTLSMETIAYNFPGIGEKNKAIRIPFTAIEKRYVVKGKTFNAMLEIFSWSMKCLASSKYPNSRHDGSAWQKHDGIRSKNAGKDMNVSAFLCEVRGDWAMYKETFQFPGWKDSGGCCWRCNVTPATMRDFGSQAQWREPANRYSHWGFLKMCMDSRRKITKLFESPGLTTDCFVIDWLHCADLGVCADFIGNLFYMVLPYVQGSNKDDRVKNLFIRIKQYYTDNKIESRLNALKFTMIRKNNKSSPKLRAYAAEARALVPFCIEIANELLTDGSVLQETAKKAAFYLNECYKCLSKNQFDIRDLNRHCICFCQMYSALESFFDGEILWRVKPKMHLFQECCKDGSNPSTNWTYRDEDFGGYVASMAKLKGGTKSVKNTATNLLLKFRAKHHIYLR